MNGTENKIEIFAPFGAAYELMKKILFQPFDFRKWCVIAFAAFISGAWGGGLHFGSWGRRAKWDFSAASYQSVAGGFSGEHFPPWAIPLIIVGVVIALLIILVLGWLSARGRFIFMDCVVKNRAAIAAPWEEFRREGNSFFVFSFAVGFGVAALMAIFFLLIALAFYPFAGSQFFHGPRAVFIFIIALLALVWIAFSIFSCVVINLMLPVMYRRRCRAIEAFLDVSKLVLARPGP
ncbi:MAG TPA: hypothetical protein VGI42_00170, partial [Chthoniobacterales bacterium]